MKELAVSEADEEEFPKDDDELACPAEVSDEGKRASDDDWDNASQT